MFQSKPQVLEQRRLELMLQIEQLPPFLQPSIKLFLSVDLIGSTKLKHDENSLQSKGSDEETLDGIGAKWFNHLIDFYGVFEEYFIQEWNAVFSQDGFAKKDWRTSETPSLWKVNGDELIYVLSISHPGQIVAALYSWRNALLQYRSRLQERKTALDVKATAWMAGFPMGNHEVAFWGDLSTASLDQVEYAEKFGQYFRLNEWYKAKKNDEKSNYVKDYIGPAVDTGFRLASYACARKFPVSMEIAYFLSKFPFDAKIKDEMPLYYSGRKSMKGVLSGVPYPVFWLDAKSPDDELTKKEDLLMPEMNRCDDKVTTEYLSLFFEDPRNKLFKPFIYGCNDNDFCLMPEKYEERLFEIYEVWEKECQKYDIQISQENNFDNDAGEELTEEELNNLEVKPKSPTS